MSCSIHFSEAAACAYHAVLSHMEAVDWFNEARLIGTSIFLVAVIVTAILYIPDEYTRRLGDKLTQYLPRWPTSGVPATQSYRRTHIHISRKIECPYNPTIRTKFTYDQVSIYAWPSCGGVIILDNADAIDFAFMGLNPVDPPLVRLDDQAAEDAFSQRLLHLGAKWWDSEARHSIVEHLKAAAAGLTDSTFVGEAFCVDPSHGEHDDYWPTMREKRWVKVGWISTGGLWVSEFDTTFGGVDEEDNLCPGDENGSRLRMARTMDERCILLRDWFRGRFYESLDDYRGHTFLNSWKTKETGEKGPLLQAQETVEMWKQAREAGCQS